MKWGTFVGLGILQDRETDCVSGKCVSQEHGTIGIHLVGVCNRVADKWKILFFLFGQLKVVDGSLLLRAQTAFVMSLGSVTGIGVGLSICGDFILLYRRRSPWICQKINWGPLGIGPFSDVF